MRSTLALLTAVALFAVPLLARAETVVEVGHNRLEPAAIMVSSGDTVRFVNTDQMPGGHTIVADDGSFSSPPLAKDESWSHTFGKAGAFGYSIQQHPSAKGIVTVK